MTKASELADILRSYSASFEDMEEAADLLLKQEAEIARQKKEPATVTYCTYGQCADRTVPCESCTVIEVKGEEDDRRPIEV